MAEQEKTRNKKGRDGVIRRLVGEQIRILRNSQNLTQEALVGKVGRNLSINSLSRYEAGLTEMGIITYFAIAAALGVDLNDLAPRELIQGIRSSTVPPGYGRLTSGNKYIVDQVINALLCQQENQQ